MVAPARETGHLDEEASAHRLRLLPVADGVVRPLWSVMIPTYNCAHYLRATLESVLCQDPGPEVMQIDVVDDCSTKDDPEQVVHDMGKGRVDFYRQKQNVGHARNFETCLQRSKGRLVHLLHGDDAVLDGFYLTMQRPFSENPKMGAAFCRNVKIDGDGLWISLSPLVEKQSGTIPDMLERLAVRQRIQTPAMVVRREVYEALGGFDRRLSWTEDWEMWARIAAHYPIWHEVELLALYRDHAGSSTGRHMLSGENVRDVRRSTNIINSYLPKDRQQRPAKAREQYAIYALKNARRMMELGEFTATRTLIREGLVCSRSPRVLSALSKLVSFACWRGVRRIWSS